MLVKDDVVRDIHASRVNLQFSITDSFEKFDVWYGAAHKCSILTPLLCGPGVVHP